MGPCMSTNRGSQMMMLTIMRDLRESDVTTRLHRKEWQNDVENRCPPPSKFHCGPQTVIIRSIEIK